MHDLDDIIDGPGSRKFEEEASEWQEEPHYEMVSPPPVPYTSIVFNAVALNIMLLPCHLCGAMVFAVFDLVAVAKSFAMFSLLIWSLALIIIMAMALPVMLSASARRWRTVPAERF